jgi:hypothetical protein
MSAPVLVLVALSSGMDRVEVASDGTAMQPPTRINIMKMSGAELGDAVAKWAMEELEDKALLFMRVSMLGNEDGPHELDAFVQSQRGQAVTALIEATASQSCAEPSVSEKGLPSGMVMQSALTALGTLATGGVRGEQWKESSAGLSRSTLLAQLGALNSTVVAMNAAGLDATTCPQAWEIQQAGLHVISSICLGHDGKDGLGLPSEATEAEAMVGQPSEASFRRETAAAAGAIEAIINVLGAMRDCVKCGLKKKDARTILDMALRALQRVLLGHETAGAERRARAAAGHVIPAMVGALDRAFSKSLMKQTVQTNMILMGQDDPDGDGKADPTLDEEWQSEIAKRPSLGRKMQEMMMAMYMEDPEHVRNAHEEAGREMPDGL